MKKYLLLLSFIPFTAVAQHPEAVMHALEQAGTNRKGLETLLTDYRKSSKEKYEAACFLISDLPYNSQPYKLQAVDARLRQLLHSADSTYYCLVAEKADTALYNEHFNKKVLAPVDQSYRKMMEQQQFQPPVVEMGEISDVSQIDADFLRRHIEHAFAIRKEVPFAARLSWNDFLDYVLPYRALSVSDARPADDYADVYAKYLHADTAQSIRNVVWRYNVTATRLHFWGGKYPFKAPLGREEMFFLGRNDCVPTADFCATTLRACGVPAAVEYNVAYKFWAGRHFHVAVPTEKGWETFSPESGLPKHRDPRFYESLNVMRVHFGRQADNPSVLRAIDEPIPELLSDSRIEDVTHHIMPTVCVTLPFNVATNHRLAYLASFHSQDLGLRPITWDLIDADKHVVHFKHVVPDHLYFPVYMDEEGDYHAFSSPVLVVADAKSKEGFKLQPINASTASHVTGHLQRKFPRKPHLYAMAQKTVGTYVIASDDPKFAQADTLGVISSVPSTSWEELELLCSCPYRYYRVCGTGQPARVYLSEIQFLTKREYNYANVADYASTASPWVRLLDEPLDKCKWKAEYDGNPQTAPDRWPHVTLKLDVPQFVHRLRYMVKHADNAVRPCRPLRASHLG